MYLFEVTGPDRDWGVHKGGYPTSLTRLTPQTLDPDPDVAGGKSRVKEDLHSMGVLREQVPISDRDTVVTPPPLSLLRTGRVVTDTDHPFRQIRPYDLLLRGNRCLYST